jgi:Icc protein
MMRVYPRQQIYDQKHIVFANWHIIMLNSQKPNAVEGYLDQYQLDYLQQSLRDYPNHHAAVIFHHHPIPVSSRWLDKLGLTNAQVFWQLLASYPTVRAVLFGHVHQQHEQIFQGIACYSAPSTCIQFKRQSADFALEKLSPGYRWIQLYPDGQLKTGVGRVARYIGEFDANAKGY